MPQHRRVHAADQRSSVDCAGTRPWSGLPTALATTAAVMAAYGSVVAPHEGFVALRSPQPPGHFFGEALFVTAASTGNETRRWVQTYSEHFPERAFPVIGVPREPDAAAWARERTEALDAHSLVLAPHRWAALRADAPLTGRPLPDEYTIHEVRTRSECASLATLEGDDDFSNRLRALKMRAVARGEAAFFAAHDGTQTTATAGVVLCQTEDGLVGRIQDVLTAPDHRRRGLAGRLITSADRWARDRGASGTVIVADPDREAIGLYRGLGYEVDSDAWMILPTRRTPAFVQP